MTTHHVNGRPLAPPHPAGLEVADFALGWESHDPTQGMR
jgi:hypothetical protein